MHEMFPNLFSPITLGNCEIKNRIVSTGHHTYLADREPSDALIAYHSARAQGGAGLIVSEIVAVHETAAFSGQLLTIDKDTDLDAYRTLADACHHHDCKLFAQLFHPGREILSSRTGFTPIAYAPSAVANERFHILPKRMSVALIEEIIDGFGHSAAELEKAGFDGVEIVGSHGYLPAQFLSPAVNQRDDEYGGDFDRRLQFVRRCIARIRQQAPSIVAGLRLSANDYEPEGLDEFAIAEICAALDDEVDYFSLVAGSSATLGASVHITAPMGVEAAYVAPLSEVVRRQLKKPVVVTGRINQPQEAEQIIANGQADLCGMTRAMISDAEMPNKAWQGQLDSIRACIACNQSCIGRAHKGVGISCLQNPCSGREIQFGSIEKIQKVKKLLVVGGGPAGMKAAVTAAQRGFQVELVEKNKQLGGQALLAQRLPGREEFGGLITNLENELKQSGVRIRCNVEATTEFVARQNADQVVLATGALAHSPELDMLDETMSVRFDDFLTGKATVGNRVVVADWRGDWTGLGLAEQLAKDGCRVSLYTNAAVSGETLQIYTRNHYLGRLYRLGVEMVVHARLYGADGDSVYFQNTLTDEPIIADGVDTLVLSMGVRSDNRLAESLDAAGIEYHTLGDCVTPLSAEEAIYDAFTLVNEIE